jgi:hypothetical protein
VANLLVLALSRAWPAVGRTRLSKGVSECGLGASRACDVQLAPLRRTAIELEHFGNCCVSSFSLSH